MKKLDEKIKEDMVDYWSLRAEDFKKLKIEEFNSDIGKRWLFEINKYLPNKKNLKILDIGTGTGFFAFLLSVGEENQERELTGIDLTEEMIKEAKNTSRILDIKNVNFFVMDAENLDFDAESFDVIVTRNVTWALPNLSKAYRCWFDVLKEDGILINFDGDYCREDNTKKLRESLENIEHVHNEITNEQWEVYENLKESLCKFSEDKLETRPTQDLGILKEIGFKVLCVDKEVGKRIFLEKDKFYNPTPIFAIVAKK